jgi:hypothetical protein
MTLADEIARALAEGSAAVAGGSPLVVTLLQTTQDSAATPWDNSPPIGVTTQLRAVVGSYDRKLVDGSAVRADDLKILVEAGGVEPTTNDRVTIKGIAYSVVSARALQPGGQVLMWELQCRR